MFKPLRKTHPVIKIINGSLIDLPTPNNISIWWNYGSLIGLYLTIQIITGLFLSIHYTSNIELAFTSVIHTSREVNFGWLLRAIHANRASILFLFLYLHIGRGIYYGSFNLKETWNIGVFLYILTIATAFTGYVLPWGQIRFWGATVITNLFSAVPYIGKLLVEWIWGGFAVNEATLNRFFSFHFILPFIIMRATILHILLLHQTGSNNPVGIITDSERVPFHSYYSIKDILGYAVAITVLSVIVLFEPSIFSDPDNFSIANPLITPIHIKPEWYFLWIYAILRSIPNKLGGIVALFSALVIVLIIPLTTKINKRSLSFYPLNQMLFWTFVTSWVLLTWIGGRPVEEPYSPIRQILTTLYFSYFILRPPLSYSWDLTCRPN